MILLNSIFKTLTEANLRHSLSQPRPTPTIRQLRSFAVKVLLCFHFLKNGQFLGLCIRVVKVVGHNGEQRSLRLQSPKQLKLGKLDDALRV